MNLIIIFTGAAHTRGDARQRVGTWELPSSDERDFETETNLT